MKTARWVITTIIALGGVVVAIIGLVVANHSDGRASKANEIAREANHLATQANGYSADANQKATEANDLADAAAEAALILEPRPRTVIARRHGRREYLVNFNFYNVGNDPAKDLVFGMALVGPQRILRAGAINTQRACSPENHEYLGEPRGNTVGSKEYTRPAPHVWIPLPATHGQQPQRTMILYWDWVNPDRHRAPPKCDTLDIPLVGAAPLRPPPPFYPRPAPRH